MNWDYLAFPFLIVLLVLGVAVWYAVMKHERCQPGEAWSASDHMCVADCPPTGCV